MENLSFNKATNNDIQILVEHRILMALELNGEQPLDAVNALKIQMTNYFTKATENKSCISIIAKCEDEVAGIGSIHLREMPGNFKNPSGKWGYIMNMYTVPKFRRNGICKGVLNALVDEAKKIGITAFELHASKAGELVYKQNGFKLHSEPTYRQFTE